MSVLVWVAAHHGITAIAKWHDPTGITILLACFAGCGVWEFGCGGARASRVPNPASRRILSKHRLIRKKSQTNEVVGAMPKTARQRRALPSPSALDFRPSTFDL